MRTILALILAVTTGYLPVARAAGTPSPSATPAPATSAAAGYPSVLLYEAPSEPPEKSSVLIWKYGDKLKPGRWYTQEQVNAIAGRITRTESERDASLDLAAQAKTDLTVASNKAPVFVTGWVWMAVGAVAGIIVGYAAAKTVL